MVIIHYQDKKYKLLLRSGLNIRSEKQFWSGLYSAIDRYSLPIAEAYRHKVIVGKLWTVLNDFGWLLNKKEL
jgi:hypothetical protein